MFSRPRLPHSHLIDCVENPHPNLSRSRVTDPIRNLCSLSGDMSHRLTNGRVSMTNLPPFLDLHQSKFQDSTNYLASSISSRRRHIVSVSPLRCDDVVVPIMSAGISFLEQPPPSAAHSSLVSDSSVPRYHHHASSLSDTSNQCSPSKQCNLRSLYVRR